MTGAGWALVGAAVLTAPVGRTASAGRLRRLGRRAAPDPRNALLTGVRGLHRTRAAGIAAALVGGLAAGVTGPLTAAVAAFVAAGVTAAGWSVGAARREQRLDVASRDAVAALAAELRAGSTPARSLAVVAAAGNSWVHDRLQVAARTSALGGDVPQSLRVGATHGDAWDRVATAWELSVGTGCSLAAVLDAVEQEQRADAEHRRLVSELMAGPRATAVLLAALPLLGLAMGAALGAAPWQVLTRTATGQLALAAGVGLDTVGLIWTVRLTRTAAAA